jgi:hypothetical protein
LQLPNVNNRVASCWYANVNFTYDINFTDGLSHQLALYVLDWTFGNRVELIEVLDAATNAVLDSRSVSNFSAGEYLVWSIRGHVLVRVTSISETDRRCE